uniref:Reverse transcriptase domain-containing protein n=1 Tax=Tanacetum cinerariifolium TaxID=118510 RepID=A0A699GT38_TANCI|nr:hypothetical protein [Tanacetum cinerariifolium]
MHTRAYNFELVEPLPEPERTLNRRLHRRNRRVPYDQRNNPPQHPRIVYPSILDINHFRHFLDTLRNYDPMDDEPMWDAYRVVPLTPGFAITISKTADEFAIKDAENEVVRLMMFPLSLTGEAKTWLNELNEGTVEMWDELRTASISCFFPSALFDRILGKIRNIIKIFYHGLSEITQEVLNAAAGGIFLYKTPNQAYQLLEDKVLLKLDWAKNKKTKSALKKTIAFADEDSNHDNWRSSGRNDYHRDNYRSNTDDKPYDLQKQFNNFIKSQQSTNAFVKETFMDLKTQLETVAKNHQVSIQNLETKFDRLTDKQSGRHSGSLPSNTQPNLRGSNLKAYQPPQARNEHVNSVFTRSDKSYNPPDNLNDQQNNSKNPINFDSDDEDDEPTP